MAVNIQQLRDYLLQNKSLSLEKIGTISIGNPAGTGEDGSATSSTQFIFDKRAGTSEGLYTFIKELQQKNINIVRSDVDSFIEESRQLMNIGSRPMYFEGIGYIFSDKNNGYKFSEQSPVGFKEAISVAGVGQENLSNMPNYNARKNRGNGLKIFLYFIILMLLGGIGYFVFSMLKEKKAAAPQQEISTDTVVVSQGQSAAPVAVIAPHKFVIEKTANAARLAGRTAQLKKYGHAIMVDTLNENGQASYRIYFQIPLQNEADTAHIKDSLARYFGKKVTIE